MDPALNIKVRQALRMDLLQYGREIFVPEGMTDDEIEAGFGRDLKSGIIKKITRMAGGHEGYEYDVVTGEPAAGKPAKKRKKAVGEMAALPPPSVQIYGNSYSAAVSKAHVTSGMSGPCMLDHILMCTVEVVSGLNAPMEIALHVSTSPDVGPFSGDMTIFRMEDPDFQLGILNGSAIQIYKQRYDTLVGWQPRNFYEFFPRMPIPYETFFLNLTVGKTNHPASVYCLCDFGPLTVAETAGVGLSRIEPRVPAPPKAPAPPRPVAVPEVRRFHNYAEIKILEATGYTIVWSSIRMTGDPVWPIEVTVVGK